MASTVVDLFQFDVRPRAVLRRFGWSVFGFFVLRGKGIVTLPLALWILGAEGYGVYSAVIAAAPAVAAIAFLNVPDGAGRLVVSAPSMEVAEARVALIRRAGLAVAAAVAAAGAAAWAVSGSMVVGWSALFAASVILFKVATVHFEYFQRTARFVRFQIGAEYVAVTAGLALAVWFGVSGMLAATTVVFAAAALVAWRTLGVAPGRDGEARAFWRPALRLSLPLLPVSLAQWALFSIDALLIYALLGKAPTGAYSAAYSISSVALLLPMGLNAVWFPTSQRLLAQSREDLRRYTVRIGQLVLLAGGALAAAAAVGAPLLSRFFADPVYDPLPACIFWIVIGFTALGACKLFEGVLYASDRPFPILTCYVAGTILNVALNLLWIPGHGIVGAAWATAVGYGATAALLAVPAFAELRRR